MDSPSEPEEPTSTPSTLAGKPNEYFFDERYTRLLDQLAREVTEEEMDDFFTTIGKDKGDFLPLEAKEIICAYTLDEDLVLWAKKEIFPKYGIHAMGLHKLKSTFVVIEKISGDARFVLTWDEAVRRFDPPIPRT